MGTFLILMLIAVITAVSAFATIGLTAARKIHIGGQPSAFILLTLLPFVILGTLIAVCASVICIFTRWYLLLPIWLIVFNIVVFAIFLLVKVNVFPGSKVDKVNKKYFQLDAGRRLLRYSVYANSIYFIPVVILFIYLSITNPAAVRTIVMLANPMTLLVGLLFPMFLIWPMTILEYIIICLWLLLIGIAFILSLNGTVRILYASKDIRKLAILYILLLLVPLTNLAVMFILCHWAKEELRDREDSGSPVPPQAGDTPYTGNTIPPRL